ncbi:MAG TPA: hypothetical protein VK567_06495, partial [Bradyrhizobium sp.]|nr:hypothetical protein [Bradyrhizobium sp.]
RFAFLHRGALRETQPASVMAGLDPAIHVFLAATIVETWMPGTSPGRANARPMTGSAKQSRNGSESWIASSLRSSQ